MNIALVLAAHHFPYQDLVSQLARSVQIAAALRGNAFIFAILFAVFPAAIGVLASLDVRCLMPAMLVPSGATRVLGS